MGALEVHDLGDEGAPDPVGSGMVEGDPPVGGIDDGQESAVVNGEPAGDFVTSPSPADRDDGSCGAGDA
ncbi:MAG: hypothetical protein D6795_10695 [Deltaproteobacteria bacterium]|nr:MAG: hypothetical protein D6795_10695 [Deltaproteobacteria bacterium]